MSQPLKSLTVRSRAERALSPEFHLMLEKAKLRFDHQIMEHEFIDILVFMMQEVNKFESITHLERKKYVMELMREFLTDPDSRTVSPNVEFLLTSLISPMIEHLLKVESGEEIINGLKQTAVALKHKACGILGCLKC